MSHVMTVPKSAQNVKFLLFPKYVVGLLLCFDIWRDHKVTSVKSEKALCCSTQAK